MPKYNLRLGNATIPIAKTESSISESIGRRLQQAKPQTQVDGGGSRHQVSFAGQEISQSELREIKQIRESGGIISSAFDAKALIRFGTGVEFYAENDELKAWLDETFPDIDLLTLELGEDATYYPYTVAEIVENRVGQFDHIRPTEPWTMLPKTDKYGDVIGWEQHLSGEYEPEMFDADELGYIILNKSSARDKTGISDVLQNKEEIETFRSNQQAMREATERLGFPFIHAKAGREGATQLNDNELRRIRNRLADIGPGETQVTGPDVSIEQMDPATVEFDKIQERDTRMLANAISIPLEMLNEGSDGLGSGKPAEVRLSLFALQNEAARRRFTAQFEQAFLRPIVEQYSPYDAGQDFGMNIKPFLDDKSDMAEYIDRVGKYMRNEDVVEKLDLPTIDDEEMAESYRPPKQIEEAEEEDQPEGGLFGSAAEEAVDNELDKRDLQDIEDIALDDYPEAAQENARMALDAREETGNPNDCLTDTGWAVANNLDSGDPISESQLESMSAFERFEDDKEQGEEGQADCGWMAWKAWGGDEGIEWADNKQEEFEEARENAAGDTDFSDCGLHLSDIDTEGWTDWEHTLFELQEGIAHGDSSRALTEITSSQIPEFVTERIRDAIFSDTLFSQFDTIADNDIMQLRTFMEEQLTQDGWTIDGIAGRLQDLEPELSKPEAERIARTESQALIQDARETGYEETGMVEDETFYWTGGTGNRTTDACKWLIGGSDMADNIGGAFDGTNPNHGGSPVPLAELKELVQKANEKDPEIDHDAREWTPHINCRKTYVRDV